MDDMRQPRVRAGRGGAPPANLAASVSGAGSRSVVRRGLLILPLAVVAVSALLGAQSPPSTSTDVRQLFDDSVLQRVDLQVNSRDWDTLRANWKLSTYYPATFQWQGQTVRNVGIRSRGTGTRSGQKPGLLIDFNRFISHQHFLGLNSVVLDNHLQDPSAMREALAMAVYAKVGLPALRVAPAELWVNGAFFGVYSLVENVDLVAARRLFAPATAAASLGRVPLSRPPAERDPIDRDRFPRPPAPPPPPPPVPAPAPVKGPNGYVYEYHWQDYFYMTYPGPDLSRYSRMLEAKTHETEPLETLFRPIERLFREINEAPDTDFATRVGAVLDLPMFVRQLAVESYLAEWDGLAGAFGLNNFYLFRAAAGGPHTIVPWDRDNTLRAVDYPLLVDADKHVLVRRALQVPELRRLFLDTLQQVAQVVEARESDGGATWLEREVIRRRNSRVGADARRPREAVQRRRVRERGRAQHRLRPRPRRHRPPAGRAVPAVGPAPPVYDTTMHSASRNLAVTVLAAAVATFAAGPVSAQSDRIRRILRETPLVDGHNDVPEQYLDRVKDQAGSDRPGVRHLDAHATHAHRHSHV